MTAHEKTTYNEVKGLLKLIETKESENPKNPKIRKSTKGPSEPSNGLKEDLVECFKITLQMKGRKERKNNYNQTILLIFYEYFNYYYKKFI